jgi:hypothetical protein
MDRQKTDNTGNEQQTGKQAGKQANRQTNKQPTSMDENVESQAAESGGRFPRKRQHKPTRPWT